VLVAGGRGGYINCEIEMSAEMYEPANNTWHQVAPMSIGRSDFALAVLADGTVMAAGGEGCVGSYPWPLPTSDVWDPANDAWFPGPFGAPGAGYSVARLASGVLAAGGHAVDDEGSQSWDIVNAAFLYTMNNFTCDTYVGCVQSPEGGIATLDECQSFCQPELFTCVVGECVPTGNSTGVLQAECEASCTLPPYVCNAGECVPSSSGIPFPLCKANCGHEDV